MAETIMTFALGFLIASGIALALAAPLWRRAADITRKRLRASSPVSLADFNAEKDRIRAEYAMAARKLELSVEEMRRKAESRLAELDRRERQVAALNLQVEEKSGVTVKQGAEIEELKHRLADAEASLDRRHAELRDLRERLHEAQNVLARQAVAIREANIMVEGQREAAQRPTGGAEPRAEEPRSVEAGVGGQRVASDDAEPHTEESSEAGEAEVEERTEPTEAASETDSNADGPATSEPRKAESRTEELT